LDNLPSEVQHLLQEIKIKEIRCQGLFLASSPIGLWDLTSTFLDSQLLLSHCKDLQQDIAKDQSKYIKSALKHSSTPSTPSSAGQANSRTASPAPVSLPTDSRSKAHLPARISAAYAEIDSLTDEKVVLAQRIIELVTRTRARLDADLAKVRLLQGESPEDTRGAYLNAGTRLMSSSPSSSPYTGATKRESSVAGLNPVIQIGESLRSAMAGGVETPISAVGPGYTKSTSTPPFLTT
jgi:chromatin modification-related protein YNG2